ncbi:MAG: hypothetical protein LBI13_00560 [Streptococcaceae bacterium]|jgi:hypothetical protein|nr:hypothetical protein [Streptococcaceae bacterium]
MGKLAEKILNREIVTVGAASEFSMLTRAEVIQFVEENALKIYDEIEGKWYNESAIGHC